MILKFLVPSRIILVTFSSIYSPEILKKIITATMNMPPFET